MRQKQNASQHLDKLNDTIVLVVFDYVRQKKMATNMAPQNL